jgi:hypothetical protein
MVRGARSPRRPCVALRDRAPRRWVEAA